MEAGLFLYLPAKGEGVESVSTPSGRVESVSTLRGSRKYPPIPSRAMQAVPKEWKGSKRIATPGGEQQMLTHSIQSHAGHP